MFRVIRVDSAVSRVIVAIQGIVAGSSSATTEMRLLMIDVIDSGLKVFTSITPTVFVDDVGAEAASSDEDEVVSKLTGFFRAVCSRLTADGLGISAAESVVTASIPAVGRRIAKKLNLRH